MFSVSVETHFWASHQLTRPDGSKERLHRHNWSVTADVSAEALNSMGLVMDFRRLKAMVDNIVAEGVPTPAFAGTSLPLRKQGQEDGKIGFQLDNTALDRVDYLQRNNTSAENVARYIYEKLEPKLPQGVKLEAVRVVEEPGCSAKFAREPDK